jgi:hypothetical protein
MIHASNDSYSGKAPHVFDNVLFGILAGLVATMAVYAIVTRKFFSMAIPFILSAVVVLQDYFIKKLNIRLYVDLIILAIGACVWRLDRKFRTKTNA